MSYHGDISLEDTIDIKFTTRRFSTGAPYTLAGTPAVSAYVGNNTTEITAGITLSVDFDSRTGLNNVRVVATAANGYTAATNVQLVITAGTVDSVSVVGEVVGSFSIAARSSLRPTVAGRTLDVSAGGEAGVDWANVGGPTTTVGLSGTTVKTATDVETDTADIQSKIGTPAGASVSADVTAVKVDTAAILVDTAEIGAAGAGLTAINLPNQTMDIVGNITGNLSGSVGSVTGAVGSVTGAVGSVTGNVGGNVAGSVASVTAAITLPTIPVDWITSSGLAASAVTEIQSGLSTLDAAGVRTAVGLAAANMDTQFGDLPTAAETAAAVLASTIETGKTLLQCIRLITAAAAGKRSGSGTASEQYDAVGNPGTARIVTNADAAGDGTPTLTP